MERSIFGRFVNMVVCERCDGEGEVVVQPCSTCKGSGREKVNRSIPIGIPPGVDDGLRLRLRNEGSAGLYGGPAGDLYLCLSVSSHPQFERDGDNILYELPLNFAQAALGDKVEVPTMNGNAILDIPAGTQHGREFRFRGKGVPKEGRRRGDQLVRVSVVTPTGLGDRERQLFEELKDSLVREEGVSGKGRLGLFGKIKEAL